MPICALVGATYFNAEHFLSQDFDFIIAVDRGYKSLQALGITPDLVVGDFDSLKFIPEGSNVLQFPSEKDESDMEIAIRGARHGGCDSLLFYGALGQRLDHTLANIQLMLGCARRGAHVAAIDQENILVALSGGGPSQIGFSSFDPILLDKGMYGRYISVFAQGGSAFGVCEQGLKYNLHNAELSDEVSLGLSNEFTGEPVCISVEKGSALVSFSVAAWPFVSEW